MSGSETAISTPASPTGLFSRMKGLLAAQGLGAFNDNAWKYLVLTLALRPIVSKTGGQGAEFNEASQTQTTLAMLIFTVPYLLLSLPAGLMADRIAKHRVIVWTKAMEVLLMGLGTLALWLYPTDMIFALAVLALMGAQSALFGPAKYGIIPELLPTEKLSEGNSLVETATMVAIIAGTGLGPVLLLADQSGKHPELTWIAGAVLTAAALAGWLCSLQVPAVPVARSEGDLFKSMGTSLRAIRTDRMLAGAVLGSVAYWLVISMLGQNVYVHTRSLNTALENKELLTGLPPALFGIGIVAGALWAGRLSAGKVEAGLIPMGSMLFALFSMALGFLSFQEQAGINTLCLMAGGMGIGAGLLVVPLNALLQWRSPTENRGSILAINNLLSIGAAAAGSMIAALVSMTGLKSGPALFASSGVIAAAALLVIFLMPQALLRMVLITLTRTVYRLHTLGRSHVPDRGGVLLTPNHMAMVDGLFLIASLSRPVRFLVYSGMYNKWWLKPFMKWLGAIEISSEGGPRMILTALRSAGDYLDRGEIVCIFPEGQISRTGTMMPFRRGFERIVKGRNVSIIPVHLDRVWGSIFSFKLGRFVFKLPELLPYPITVNFGRPLPSTASAAEVRTQIMELGTEAWSSRRREYLPLGRTLIRALRHRRWRFAWGDVQRPAVNRLMALTGSIALARALRKAWKDQPRVGILLPPSVAGMMANAAATLSGRCSAHMNYTAGPAALASAARQAELKTVLTSKMFLEKFPVELPEQLKVLHAEDVARSIGPMQKFQALCLALFAPARCVEWACGATRKPVLDDEATVIFSSGSTGEPKGVPLTHYNLMSNIDAAIQMFPLGSDDKLLGILPFFHSFGYMTSWFASTRSIGIFFHPNPVDPAAIGHLVETHRITLMIATPTFLQFYLRRCESGQFGSLRMVLTGAEKLPQRLADAFEEKFGIRPMEGYGTTECAPIVSANTLDVRYEGVFQAGSRKGTVGQPLPGVSARIVDPDTGAPVEPGSPGMLLVKGPNVMNGYLGRPDLNEQVFRDGWYVTGDIARLDADGFLAITDRLSRFSKIGGEMVPHGRIEEALHEAAGQSTQIFAVTAVPDEKKGERLAVLHTWDEKKIGELIEKLGAMGLPNLFIPRPDHFIKVEQLPLLGTGKLDLRQLKKLAGEHLN